ncbi:jg8397 [Pararge aegeria aegeria]|uniref:Jg8397 protein n=1 Tax=Pararge aegeria aegeria TaxID=348720 RepID=A0A8S4SI30_9NEOP|nr:jg8397 [Pararge aegeria aegeria]
MNRPCMGKVFMDFISSSADNVFLLGGKERKKKERNSLCQIQPDKGDIERCQETGYSFISTGFKNKLLLMHGYTFAQMHSPKHWYCSQKRKGCKAKIKLDAEGTILAAFTQHCHEPPQLYASKGGKYFVMRNSNMRRS